MKDETLVWCIRDVPTGSLRKPWQIYVWYTDETYPMISKSDVFETFEEANAAYIKAEMARIAQLRTALRQAEYALDAYVETTKCE